MDEPTKHLLQFIGLLVGLGVLWLITGGYQQTLDDRVNVQIVDSNGNPVQNTNSRHWSLFGNIQNDTVDNTTNNNSSNNSSSNSSSNNTDDVAPYLDPQYASIPNKSPHYKLVSLDTYTLYDDAPDNEILKLEADEDLKSRVKITGWRIESTETGRGITIRKGLVLPFSDPRQNLEEDIYLRPEDKAYIVSGRSPVGYSFFENKCSGYYQQYQDFRPSINERCPSVDEEKLPTKPNRLKDECLDYLRSFPRCHTPSDDIPEDLSNECRNFLFDHVGYSYCIQAHKPDSDFYGDTWRIYLNQGDTLWKSQRETIRLTDEKGRLVDEIKYGY